MLDIRRSRDGAPRIIVDHDGHRYALPLTGGVSQIGRRVDVRDWIGVNIQCVPQDEIDRRKKAGLPSLASEHHLGERAHSYHPATIAGYKHLTAKALLDFLDPQPEGVTRVNGPVYRDFVNTGQLTETGEYAAPGRDQWLRDWIAHGGRVLIVNAAMHNERPDAASIASGPAACRDYLMQTGPQGVEAMRRIARLIARLMPEEQAAVLAVETMNEPAIYDKIGGGTYGDTGLTEADTLALFEADQAAIARAAFAEGIPDHVLVLFPRYKYNSDARSLTAPDASGASILDRWRDEFGDRVGISTHKYADWVPGNSTDEWARNWIADMAQIPPEVPQVVTEANGSDFRGVEYKSGPHHFGWTLPEIMAATGVPILYFPGANWGGAPLYKSAPAPDRTSEPDRMFTWFDAVARTLRPEPLDVTLPIHVERSETDARHVPGNDDNRIRAGLRIIRLGDGDAEIALSGPEAVMCFGGTGNQRVTMNPDEFSWFSGGPGSDTVDASETPGCIVNLGDGEDTILLGGNRVTVNGRCAGDVFVLADRGTADVFGFDPARDRIQAGGIPYTLDGKPLTIRTAGGGIVKLHGQIGGKAIGPVKAAIIP